MMNNNLKDLPKTEDKLITSLTDDFTADSPIQTFYKDKGVFLTGGTGFFGKIIIEKLLRVTEVEQIYVLIRNKKGKDAYTRLAELFEDPVFEKLKKCNPKYRQKISIIGGDCSLPALGISPDHRETIRENVNIIIHAAATVRFDEKLKMAIAINVNGTKEILKLAKEIVHLKALVHVSTAFAHSNHSYIQEKFYEADMTGENACRLGECLDEHTLNSLTPSIIKGYPNTYTFTKMLAENIVLTSAEQLPVTIFRPGIVITTLKEPVSGWIDNMYGPCGIVVGIAAGVLRVLRGKDENTAHMVPVDMCVNALLTSAWDIARNTYEAPPIYNYIPDADNLVTWKEFVQFGFQFGVNIPLSRSLWYPCFSMVPSAWQYHILSFFYHLVPAIFMDFLLLIVGKKPRMMKIYSKIQKFCSVLAYFSCNEFRFDNHNTRALSSKLTGADRELFLFDMRSIDWNELFKSNLYGLRLYVVKDEPSNLPESIKRYKRMRILHYTTLFALLSISVAAFYFSIKCLFL